MLLLKCFSIYYPFLIILSDLTAPPLGHVAMNSSTNLTSALLPEELQAGTDIVMTIAFLGVVVGVMTILLAGTTYVRRKERKQKDMVRKLTNEFN